MQHSNQALGAHWPWPHSHQHCSFHSASQQERRFARASGVRACQLWNRWGSHAEFASLAGPGVWGSTIAIQRADEFASGGLKIRGCQNRFSSFVSVFHFVFGKHFSIVSLPGHAFNLSGQPQQQPADGRCKRPAASRGHGSPVQVWNRHVSCLASGEYE